MKRKNNIYPYIIDINNIIEITNHVIKKCKNKKKVDFFESYKMEHIYNIKMRLKEKNTKFSKYNIFMITDPKSRIIMAQKLEDKIINHLIAKYALVNVFDKTYTISMIATRKNMGTSFGIKLLKKYINKIKKKHKNFYVLKIDIKKYFYNIDHEVLKNILKKHLKDKTILDYLNSIIDSTNEKYINEEIINLKKNRIKYLESTNLNNKRKLIEEVENIPLYKYGKGVALGNLTSQAFGLIYLNEINHFIKEKLRIKYLINYMDDFVIIHHDKEYLKYSLNEITTKLKTEFKLDVNDKKTRIDNIKNGIDFLGYKFYLKNNRLILKVRNKTKKKFKKKTKHLKLLLENDYINTREYKQLLASYKGIMINGSAKSLYCKYFYN